MVLSTKKTIYRKDDLLIWKCTPFLTCNTGQGRDCILQAYTGRFVDISIYVQSIFSDK